MVALNTVKVGDVLYDCHKVKMGNTTMTKMACYTVRIDEVHDDYVIASWNGNPGKRMGLRQIAKLRRTPVKTK